LRSEAEEPKGNPEGLAAGILFYYTQKLCYFNMIISPRGKNFVVHGNRTFTEKNIKISIQCYTRNEMIFGFRACSDVIPTDAGIFIITEK